MIPSSERRCVVIPSIFFGVFSTIFFFFVYVWFSVATTKQQRYSALRRVRGDGNCFYRSFLFGYLERLLQGIKSVGDANTKAMLELSRLRQVVHDRSVWSVCVGVWVSVSDFKLILRVPCSLQRGIMRALPVYSSRGTQLARSKEFALLSPVEGSRGPCM